jgi:hypothetical protein
MSCCYTDGWQNRRQNAQVLVLQIEQPTPFNFFRHTKGSVKSFSLEMHIYCKIIITIGLSILVIDRTPQILVSNCTWSHINTDI